MGPQPGLPAGIQRTLCFRRQILSWVCFLNLSQDLCELLFEPGVEYRIGCRDDAFGTEVTGGLAKEGQQVGGASKVVLGRLYGGMGFCLPRRTWLGDGLIGSGFIFI